MSRRRFCVAIACLSCAATAALGAEVAGHRTAEFPMAEVPVVSLKGVYLSHGTWFEATPQRDAEVKAYPILKSAQPLYGEARFGEGWPGREEGRRLHFVIDESQGTGKGRDRLYLDLGGNLDLSDDRPAAFTQRALTTARDSKEVCLDFEVLDIPWDYGQGVGARPFRVQPSLLSMPGEGSAKVAFAPTQARLGKTTIRGHTYEAILSPGGSLAVRCDHPKTVLYLTRLEEGGRRRNDHWWGSDFLGQLRPIDGTWYAFTSTPLGDRLIVREYGGDLGVFRADKGGRDLKEPVTMWGLLRGTDTGVPVGNYKAGTEKFETVEQIFRLLSAAEVLVPTGDYYPENLRVRLGRLEFNVSNNRHADGRRRGAEGTRYALAIRKDKPFVLDFSNKPAVLFTDPAKDARFKPGQEVDVRAVLIDPVLDLVIGGLADVSGTADAVTKGDEGTGSGAAVRRWLHPMVVITDGSGRKVAEGVMPFG